MTGAYIATPSMANFVKALQQHANSGIWNGRDNSPYYRAAFRVYANSGVSLGLTRDEGHHTSGWFKNPDYERCYHLSIMFRDPETEAPIRFDFKAAKVWIQLVFPAWQRFIWEEGQVSHIPVRHYRVFCDAAWKPIVPRGEVYTRDFIEKGWKSWSDVQDDKRKEGDV